MKEKTVAHQDDVKSYRMKYWGEIETEDKCERLRSQVKRQEKQIKRLMQFVQSMRNHSHSTTGEIVVPLRGNFGDGDEAEHPRQIENTEVYF